MATSLRNYTLKYLVIALLIVTAVWAGLFYAFIIDEVYDNVDDGLKNQKINIIREAYNDAAILHADSFGINQFRIMPAKNIQKENVFSNEMIYMEYDDEMEPYRVLRTGFFDRKGNPFTLEIRTSTVEEDDFLIDLTVALIVLYCCIIFSIYIINRLVLNKALKPLKSIINNLKRYRFGGNTGIEPVKSSVKEFDILDEKMREMIRLNEAIFNQQKQFIENASHELQTPLAITINKLELLMDDGELSETQMLAVSETKTMLHRMAHLNKSLLMLTRIENRQFVETTQVSFNKEFEDILQESEDLLSFHQIRVNYRPEANFVMNANKTLIRILLSNLLRNAIRYNYDTGSIDVTISNNLFRISNTGKATSLNAAFIFERFYKQSQDPASTGLGLSIVQSIVKTYPELSVEYSYSERIHHFSVFKS